MGLYRQGAVLGADTKPPQDNIRYTSGILRANTGNGILVETGVVTS